MGDLDLYQRKDALPHSYTLKRDEPLKQCPGQEAGGGLLHWRELRRGTVLRSHRNPTEYSKQVYLAPNGRVCGTGA